MKYMLLTTCYSFSFPLHHKLDSRAFQALPDGSFLRSRALDAPSQMAFPHVSLNHGDAANEVRHAIRLACEKKWAGKDKVVTLRPDSLTDEGKLAMESAFVITK
jgi:hypothetical protein